MIKEYLKNNILITDGAMGTYYAQVTGNDIIFSELANKTAPDVIRNIHREYIASGAKLIRTNTFSANTKTLKISREALKEVIIKGYQIAVQAIEDREVFIAADIGPIPEIVDNNEIDKINIIEEYKFIVDTFLEAGAKIFVFETFSSIDYLEQITAYIKKKNKDAFIITQFVIMGDGYTRKGISAARIVKEVKKIPTIDAYGFNCGTGPTHLYNGIKEIDFSNDIVSILPNAGFPEIINERTVYTPNEEYFADKLMDIQRLGAKIIGGCCGTTPVHISKIREKLEKQEEKKDGNIKIKHREKLKQAVEKYAIENKAVKKKTSEKLSFSAKLKKNEFTIAVELDPPFGANIDKMLEGASILKENGVDIITIADSPLARVRVNPMFVASKIKREVGIDTIPHICCRDRNIIALKSDMLAAYMEGIRNVLVVTGDPIAGAEKNEIKSVFNLNSLKLMKLISEMNKEQFEEEPYNIGGALNLNVYNKDVEVARMYKKVEAGASFFLTQPIYEKKVIAYLPKIKRLNGEKILGGIMPIVSYRNAQFLNNEIPGIKIPDDYINRFKEDMQRDEAEEVGIEIAVEIANKIKQHVDGFYLVTPFNRVHMIAKILHKIL